MTAPTPYVMLPGTAREALETYARVFGGTTEIHRAADMGQEASEPDAVGHGILRGPVDLYAADAAPGEPTVVTRGLMLSLLGAADATTSRRWFAALADGGTVLDPLQRRPWGAHDGQVRDRFGVHWLVGFEDE